MEVRQKLEPGSIPPASRSAGGALQGSLGKEAIPQLGAGRGHGKAGARERERTHWLSEAAASGPQLQQLAQLLLIHRDAAYRTSGVQPTHLLPGGPDLGWSQVWVTEPAGCHHKGSLSKCKPNLG